MTSTSASLSFAEMKATSRQELRCYVDSWSGPVSGSDRHENKPCVYAFRAPSTTLVKVGHTSKPIHRLYQLRLGTCPAFAPLDSEDGYFLYLEPCRTKRESMRAEQLAHRILAPHRMRTRLEGGWQQFKVEWFKAEDEQVVKAIQLAVAAVEGLLMDYDLHELQYLVTQM